MAWCFTIGKLRLNTGAVVQQLFKSTASKWLAATLLISLTATATLALAGDATEQQQEAIRRIDAFVDHFRKTGERPAGGLVEPERMLGETVKTFLAQGDMTSVALSLIKLGAIQRMQGNWEPALKFYQLAEATARNAHHVPHQAKALMGWAQTEQGQRNFGSAERHAEEAVALATPLPDKSFLFDALNLLATIQLDQGNVTAAAETLNRALGLPGITDELAFYGVLKSGDVYLKIAEQCDYQRKFDACLQATEKAKDNYRKAMAIAVKLGWTGLAKQSEGFLKNADARAALINVRRQDHEKLQTTKAFQPEKPQDVLVTERFVSGGQSLLPEMMQIYQQYKQSEAQAGGFGDVVAVTSLYDDGIMLQSKGDHVGALSKFLKSIETLEQDRRKLQDDNARGRLVEDKLGAYYAAIAELLDQHRHAEAFGLMERSRARAMADILASRPLDFSKPTEQTLYAELVQLRTEIGTRQAELFRLINTGAKADTMAPVERQITTLQQAHQKLLARISAEAPNLKELTESQPVALSALQGQMKKDDFSVLEYLVTETNVIVWYIDRDSVQVRNVFLPRSALQAKVSSLQRSLSDRKNAFDHKTARELFLFLIQPMLASIRSHKLVIIPHDALHAIPFQVLENPADGTSLGERFQLSYAPSATVFASLKNRSAGSAQTLLAAADPDIVAGDREVLGIAQLYGGRSKVVTDHLINEADLKTSVGNYDVIHLAVHGNFVGREPLLSYLKLGKDEKDDGHLTAAEMFGLPLDKTSLVVFSACETGKAETTYSNEVQGMVSALLYAGARTLVLSYWQVDTASTALWMATFHKALQSVPPTEAARRALVAVKSRPEFAHPNYWGAFMLVSR